MNQPAVPQQQGRKRSHITLWTLQILVAVAYLAFGFSKVGGSEQAVTFFDEIGWGDWFRYLIGTLELLAAVALLIPRIVLLAALTMAVLIVESIVAHAALGDANGIVFVVPLALVSVIAWGRRDRKPMVPAQQA
jgi:uncharacterized membrane protein YphA (DoxX/SURF4 family)